MTDDDRDLQAQLAALPDLPPGYDAARAGRAKAKLMLALDANEAPAPRAAATSPHPVAGRRWWPRVAAPVALAAAVVLYLVFRGGDATRVEPSLVAENQPGPRPKLGNGASIGDTWLVTGTLPGDGELRVYDDATKRERARCTTAAPSTGCTIERIAGGVRVRLALPLTEPATLRAYLFTPAFDPLSQDRDADLRTAEQRGIRVLGGPRIDVR